MREKYNIVYLLWTQIYCTVDHSTDDVESFYCRRYYSITEALFLLVVNQKILLRVLFFFFMLKVVRPSGTGSFKSSFLIDVGSNFIFKLNAIESCFQLNSDKSNFNFLSF
jgi:hypothetical protein